MEITLPEDLDSKVQLAVASGRFRSFDDLVEQAVRSFLNESQRGQERLDALRRLGQAVDRAGLYERVFFPD